jgi:4a-hydroxytetrahydrobiopterin dehydratase
MSLAEKRCVPCEGGVPPMVDDEAHRLLKQLNERWFLNEKGHLYAAFKFSNFVQALDFANKVGVIAEEEAHHPDLLVAWGKCGVEIWTHKIQGLTESDFILAAKIDLLESGK